MFYGSVLGPWNKKKSIFLSSDFFSQNSEIKIRIWENRGPHPLPYFSDGLVALHHPGKIRNPNLHGTRQPSATERKMDERSADGWMVRR